MTLELGGVRARVSPSFFLPSTRAIEFYPRGRAFPSPQSDSILESHHVLPRNVCYHYRGIQPGAKCTFLGVSKCWGIVREKWECGLLGRYFAE